MTFAFDMTVTLSLIFNVAMVVVVWIRTRGDKVAEGFEKVGVQFKAGSDRMDRHEIRLTAIEQAIRTMPGKDGLHQLELRMAEMTGEMRRQTAVIEGHVDMTKRLEVIVNRHEQHLLDGVTR